MSEEICMVTADDCSIEVVSEGESSGCYTVESILEGARDPTEQRKDITEMKGLVACLEEKLTFNNSELINEELEKLKPRKNFETLFDTELENVSLASKPLEEKDPEFFKELRSALELCPKIKELAGQMDASLKRPLEILEDALPIVLASCELENLETSNEPSEALKKYEESRIEMERCEEEFDMDGRKAKQTESVAHLEKAMAKAKEGREQSEAWIKKEEERNLLQQIEETKENVGILVVSEIDDLKKKCLACAKDITEIESSQEEQKRRIEAATASYKIKEKRSVRRIIDLEQKRADLEKQLENVEKEKEKLIQTVELEKETQKTAEDWHERVMKSLSERHTNISAIWERVRVLSDILGLVNVFSNHLFDSAKNAQIKYEKNLKKLEVQALSQEWNVLAHGVVDNMLEVDNIKENIADYEARMKQLRNDMSVAARRGQAAIVKKSKEDMMIFQQEVELQKLLHDSIQQGLARLKDAHKEVNDRLVERGIILGNIGELYTRKKRKRDNSGKESPDSLLSF